MEYRIILDKPERPGVTTGHAKITEEGALIIWSAYRKLFGNCQTMSQRENRGGVCWLSEIPYFKERGALDKDFDWKKYQVPETC